MINRYKSSSQIARVLTENWMACNMYCPVSGSDKINRYANNQPVADFLIHMKSLASECYRVLKNDKFCAILMGDTRIKGHVQTMSFEVMKIFESEGFKLKELIIKEQHNCRATGYWKTNSIRTSLKTSVFRDFP